MKLAEILSARDLATRYCQTQYPKIKAQYPTLPLLVLNDRADILVEEGAASFKFRPLSQMEVTLTVRGKDVELAVKDLKVHTK